MLNRNEEKCEVKHANTERFLKSAIPHMQRLLNDEKNNEKDIRISSRMPGWIKCKISNNSVICTSEL